MQYSYIIVFFLAICFSSCADAPKEMPPNIVLIMCDDMGFSDLGCYGGEIQTPHIDALADNGLRFSQFKNTGRCCPSRAALLTGRPQHAVEMGWMTAVDEHRPGYRGQLTDKAPTIAEILKENGYRTYASGKWHLTLDGAWSPKEAKPNGSWPTQRGFDQYYGSLAGGNGYYRVHGLKRNETRIDTFPEDYYYTSAITENAVQFITDHDPEQPLFLYIAHFAPHRPLQAPQERIDKCRKRYEVGYDQLRTARFEQLREMGFLESELELPVHQREYPDGRPAWDSLSPEKKEKWITEMATYAAMIEIMDDGIGEVVNATRQKGIYDNTVFIFLSDNGATYEGGQISQLAADLSNTPYRSYKQFTYFGGTSSPLIIQYPRDLYKYRGQIREARAHITDLLPTCLDLAGLEYPEKFGNVPLPSLESTSLVPAFHQKDRKDRDFFFEHQSSCAIISGDWKLVRARESEPWELINLKEDPFEQRNAAADHPEKVEELSSRWEQWAEANQVLPLESKPWTRRIKHYKQKNADQDGVDD